MKKTLFIIAASGVLISPLALSAEWKGSSELGLLMQRGNSESDTLNAKFKVTRDAQPWRNSLRLEASNTSSADKRTGEKYLAETKTDYKLTERSYIFNQIQYEDNRFSGYEYQASITFGYGNQVIKSEDMNLFLEIGPGYRVSEQENSGDKLEEAVARFGERFDMALSKTAKLEQSLVVLSGDELTTTEFKIGVTSNLTKSFALKVGYGLKYSDTVAADKKHADEETTVSLVYSF